MPIDAGTVAASLELNTRGFLNPLRTARNELSLFGNDASAFGQRLQGVGSKMTSAGKAFTTGFTLPIVGAGAGLVKLAGDFEESGNKVATIADQSVMSIEAIQEGVLKLSDDVGVADTDINEALYQTISATGDTKNSLEYVEIASKAAIGGFTDTSTAVDGLTTVMNTYGLKGSEAMQSVSDQMLQAQNFGKTTFGELASSIGNVIPIAASLDVSTNELFASLATLTKNGIATSQAVTGLKAAYSNIIKPSKQAGELAEELGLEFNSAHLKSVGWAMFLDEIREKTKGNTEMMAQLFGSTEALNSVTVLATNGAKDFSLALEAMSNSAGATEKAFSIMDQGVNDSFEDTLNSAKNLGIELGQILLPIANDIIGVIGEWVQKFKELDDGTKENILKIGAVVAAIGPLLLIGGKIVSGVGMLISGISTVSTAIGVATGAVTTATGAAGALGTALTVLSGPVGLIVAGIAAVTAGGIALYSHLSQDSIPAIERFGNEISESTKKAVGGFLDLNDKATMALKKLNWSGAIVSEKTANEITSNLNGMADKVIGEYETMQKEAVEQLDILFSNSTSISKEEQDAMYKAVKDGTEKRYKIIEKEKARVSEILNKAKEEHRALTEAEQKEINVIQSSMVDQGIKVLSDSEREQKAIFEKMRANASTLSALQAAEVVKNATDQKNAVVAEAEEQYTNVVKEVTRQRDEIGSLSAEQADKLIAEALRQKEDTISHAEETHEKIVEEAKLQAEEHVNEVDWETGEIKSKWDVWKDDLATTLSESWEYQKNGFREAGENIKTSVTTLVNNIISKWDDTKTKVSNTIANLKKDAENKWTNLKSNLEKYTNTLKTNIVNKYEELKTSAVQKIEEKKKAIIEKWTKLRDDAGTWATNMMNTFTKGIKDKIESVKTAVGNVATAISNFLGFGKDGSAPDKGDAKDADSWGGNFVGMIAKGIKSKIELVENAVKNVAVTLQDYLGFHSPTKKGVGAESDEWAPNFMTMFADGIDENIGLVETSASAVTTMLENEFNGAVQTAKKKAAEIQRTFANALASHQAGSHDQFGNYTDRWGDTYNEYDYKDRDDDDDYERKKYKSDLEDKDIDYMLKERVKENKFVDENPETTKEIREQYKKETGHEPDKSVIYDIARNGGINDRKRDDWKKDAKDISDKADRGDYDKDIKKKEEIAKNAWARNDEERKKNQEEKRKNGGYAKGTDNATRGWHLVGEEGPEIRWFEGGETVLDTATSMNLIDKLSNIGNMEFLVKVSSTLEIDYEKLANAIGSKLKPSINVENTFNSPKSLDEKTIKRQETMLMRDLAIKFR